MARGGARPGAGRKKGSPNKRTRTIEEKLAALKCDPIEGMARIALDEANDIQIRAQMLKELAQYVAPKRAAQQHTGADDGPIEFVVRWQK